MDKSLRYKEIVKNILNRYVEIDRQQAVEGIEYYLVSDDVQGHYIWGSIGWLKGKRKRSITAHIRVKENKIWVETDFTEEGITKDFINKGIPKEDIVLAFHEPSMRQYTEFAPA